MNQFTPNTYVNTITDRPIRCGSRTDSCVSACKVQLKNQRSREKLSQVVIIREKESKHQQENKTIMLLRCIGMGENGTFFL